MSSREQDPDTVDDATDASGPGQATRRASGSSDDVVGFDGDNYDHRTDGWTVAEATADDD